MQIGLSTAAFYGRFETEEAAAHMRKLPIDCAEVFLQSSSEYSAEFARVVRENLGSIACTSIHPLGHHERFMARKPARQMRDALDEYRRILDAGAELGAKTYVYHGLHTSLLKPLKWDLQWNYEAISRMCEEADKRAMTVAWENVYWCQLTKPELVLEARKMLPQVRFTLDIKQAVRAGCDPIDFLRSMGDRLVNVHVCDWNANGELCLPGEGIFNFELFFRELEEIGYRGPVILEPYLRLIRDEPSLVASIEHIRDFLK